MFLKTIKDCQQIDLKKHGLIEASAGTGKTYLIENLVVRLLKEREDIALDEILLVTFTEKATCDLKIRIREKLEKELSDSDDNRIAKRLQNALDLFDTASIYTIHGFCQTILKDFAFENAALFQNEVINDRPLFQAELKELMRKKWPDQYGQNIEEILQCAGFRAKKEKSRFINTVLEVAGKTYRENAGDILLPDLKDKSFKQLKEETIKSVMDLKKLIGSDGKFSKGFDRLNINKRTKESLQKKIIIPLEEYLAGNSENNLNIALLLDLITSIDKVKSGEGKGIQSLIPVKWLKKGANPEVCPALENVVSCFEQIITTASSIKQYLAIQTIHLLQQEVGRTKQKHGWISFDDMLTLVEKALYCDTSSNPLSLLRNKYKVAFIDEFQDTDPVQWKIFKKIFLDHKDVDPKASPKNLLFLIGDPKQAIYSFRGADVYAYLEAKEEIISLAQAKKANLYSLATNWRSQPELIESFNCLFCRSEWFKPVKQAGEFEIGYQYSGSPEEKDRLAALSVDYSGRSVLNIVDLSSAVSSPGIAKSLLANFIAGEIQYLTALGGIELPERDRTETALSFGDICILVRGKLDVPFLESELLNLSIPYTYYKKPGLFLSDEALYISLVFHAILEPGNRSEVKKALLTPFFGFRPEDLYAYDEMPLSHPVKQILLRWHTYAMSRRWSLLFQSLIEESGLLFREAAKSRWDRKETNYRQIFEHLDEIAYLKNLDFRKLAAMLANYRNQTVFPLEDADIHEIETEEKKVQIMTMHVSKGLQFPVVFIAGGLTMRPTHMDYYNIYHNIVTEGSLTKATKIIDLSGQSGNKEHAREKIDEDKRLYYVASTRAQYKLYLPYYPFTGKQNWVGPVCSLLSPVLDRAFPKHSDNRNILWLSPDQHSMARDSMMQGKQRDLPAIEKKEVAGFFPCTRNFIHRKIKLESFSSLNCKSFFFHENVKQGPDFLALYEKSKEDDESFASQKIDAGAVDITPDEMPGGAEVGSMFHNILELIDFETVYAKLRYKTDNVGSLINDSEIGDIILRQMDIYRVDKCWQQHICRIIANTLTTPVRFIDDEFVLGKLRKEDRLHEVAFYYPFPLPLDDNKKIPEKIPDCKITNGFIKGFIDLIFKYAGKYYLADWKSNYIEDGYARDAMEVNMNHANYHLQYKLYNIALIRWLKQVLGGKFNPAKDFGGVFYFYLRGMEPGTENGIYHVPGEKLGDLDRLEREVAAILTD